MFNISEWDTFAWGDSGGVLADALPANFALRNGWEGPQVIVKWDAVPEAAVLSMRLLRKIGSYSRDVEDGKKLIVQGGAPYATEYVDREVESGVVYYYTLTVEERITSAFVFSNTTRGSMMPLDTAFFRERLFGLLPPTHRLLDKGIA